MICHTKKGQQAHNTKVWYWRFARLMWPNIVGATTRVLCCGHLSMLERDVSVFIKATTRISCCDPFL